MTQDTAISSRTFVLKVGTFKRVCTFVRLNAFKRGGLDVRTIYDIADRRVQRTLAKEVRGLGPTRGLAAARKRPWPQMAAAPERPWADMQWPPPPLAVARRWPWPHWPGSGRGLTVA
jgi:hypothetical protein